MRDRIATLVKATVLICIGAVLIALASANMNTYLLSITMVVGINVILVASLNITNGFIGLFSLGHPAFMMLGGYLTAILAMPSARKAFMLPDLPHFLAVQEWNFLPALLAGGMFAGIVAAIVGYPLLRLRGHYLAVATLGLIFIVQSFAINLDNLTRGARGISGLPALTTVWWVYLFMVVTIYVCWRLKSSSLGRSMLSIREDELAARSLGIHVTRVRMLAFVLGAFFAGIAGGLWVHVITVISPNTFPFILAFQLVVMVVVGGSGSITGSVLAAIVITVASEYLKNIEEHIGVYGLSQVITAVGVILILIYRPSGIFGTIEPSLFNWITRFLPISRSISDSDTKNQ